MTLNISEQQLQEIESANLDQLVDSMVEISEINEQFDFDLEEIIFN